MIFYKTSTFDNQLKKLEKKQKDGYASCNKDIRNFFKDKTLSVLWTYRNTEQEISETKRLKKSRIVNSYQKKGSSGGYRIVYIVDIQKDIVTLLYVYPKQGKYAQTNYTAERKSILTTYLNELTSNELTIYILDE